MIDINLMATHEGKSFKFVNEIKEKKEGNSLRDNIIDQRLYYFTI